MGTRSTRGVTRAPRVIRQLGARHDTESRPVREAGRGGSVFNSLSASASRRARVPRSGCPECPGEAPHGGRVRRDVAAFDAPDLIARDAGQGAGVPLVEAEPIPPPTDDVDWLPGAGG